MATIDFYDDTRSLHQMGHILTQRPDLLNAFLKALPQRIALTIITSKMWNSPLAFAERGTFEYGETIEEIFVNLASPHGYDPDAAQGGAQFKREIADVRAAFYTINWQKFYRVTIEQRTINQAFTSFSGVTDLIAKMVESLYTGMYKDKYLTTKYVIARALLNGAVKPVTVAAYEGANGDPDGMLTAFREYSNLLPILSSEYNAAGVETFTEPDKLHLLIPAHPEAVLGVKGLAYAFNLDEVTYMGKRTIIDSFDFNAADTARLAELFADDATYKPFTADEIGHLQKVVAFATDVDWYRIYTNLLQATAVENQLGLYTNNILHVWMTYAVSPFANAIAFTTEASAITKVTVTPATASVAQGASTQLTAEVTATGLPDKTVTWTLTGNEASGTYVNPLSGLVHVAKDEKVGGKLTVTATARDGKTGTSTITVTAGA